MIRVGYYPEEYPPSPSEALIPAFSERNTTVHALISNPSLPALNAYSLLYDFSTL